jgi:hypothetical protein
MTTLKALLFSVTLSAVATVPAHAVSLSQLHCDDIVRNGWDKMPDVADDIRALPGSDKLGFGSECHLGSLVFAQCFVEPRWTVKQAVDALIWKAAHGKRLPDTPVCGA